MSETVEVKYPSQTVLPAFTICPTFAEAYNGTAFKQMNLTKSKFKNGIFYSADANYTPTAEEVFLKVICCVYTLIIAI